MTMTELSQRKEAHQGPEFRTRLEVIRFLVEHDKGKQSVSSNKNTNILYEDSDDEHTDSSDMEDI